MTQGKIRFTSVTNFNLEYLQKYHQVFKEKLFSHELCFNFEIRENEVLSITEYARNNEILNVIYQPLRRNRTSHRNWPVLLELSQKYNKTQNQVLLNWLSAKGFYPLIKSDKIEHINENLEAWSFTLDTDDIKKLNNFSVSGYKSPKIDWFMTGDGTKIHAIPNEFDEKYPAI